MDEVQFRIEAEPVPAARPRVTSRGMTFYPKKHTAYAKYLSDVLQDAPALKAKGAVEVRIKFVMPPYKTSDHPVHRADVDNLSKLPLDCMTKATAMEVPRFWEDDHMIVLLQAYKRFARDGEEPHTEIRCIKIDEDISDFIDRRFSE
jgi:Holliday junction resolvase RusA-like endonuclease